MSVFAKATPAPKPKTPEVRKISVFYAVILVIMAVAQLYSFDTFIELFATFHLPFSETIVSLVAPMLVLCEVLALPFLLSMSLSPAFRFVSMVSGWLVAIKWIFLTLWIVLMTSHVTTVGFLGTVVDLMPGWWAVCIGLSFGILTAWSSWGMWPIRHCKK